MILLVHPGSTDAYLITLVVLAFTPSHSSKKNLAPPLLPKFAGRLGHTRLPQLTAKAVRTSVYTVYLVRWATFFSSKSS